MESDVFRETKRIEGLDINKLIDIEPLVVKNLFKKFKKNKKTLIAVNNLSFGIKKSTCFGYFY